MSNWSFVQKALNSLSLKEIEKELLNKNELSKDEKKLLEQSRDSVHKNRRGKEDNINSAKDTKRS